MQCIGGKPELVSVTRAPGWVMLIALVCADDTDTDTLTRPEAFSRGIAGGVNDLFGWFDINGVFPSLPPKPARAGGPLSLWAQGSEAEACSCVLVVLTSNFLAVPAVVAPRTIGGLRA